MVIAYFASIVGLSLIGVIVFKSSYRYWLHVVTAGTLFWGLVEFIRLGLQWILDISMIHGYVWSGILASGVALLFLLYLDQRSQKNTVKHVIEHTPFMGEKNV